jgi:ribonuclease E
VNPQLPVYACALLACQPDALEGRLLAAMEAAAQAALQPKAPAGGGGGRAGARHGWRPGAAIGGAAAGGEAAAARAGGNAAQGVEVGEGSWGRLGSGDMDAAAGSHAADVGNDECAELGSPGEAGRVRTKRRRRRGAAAAAAAAAAGEEEETWEAGGPRAAAAAVAGSNLALLGSDEEGSWLGGTQQGATQHNGEEDPEDSWVEGTQQGATQQEASAGGPGAKAWPDASMLF